MYPHFLPHQDLLKRIERIAIIFPLILLCMRKQLEEELRQSIPSLYRPPCQGMSKIKGKTEMWREMNYQLYSTLSQSQLILLPSLSMCILMCKIVSEYSNVFPRILQSKTDWYHAMKTTPSSDTWRSPWTFWLKMLFRCLSQGDFTFFIPQWRALFLIGDLRDFWWLFMGQNRGKILDDLSRRINT